MSQTTNEQFYYKRFFKQLNTGLGLMNNHEPLFRRAPNEAFFQNFEGLKSLANKFQIGDKIAVSLDGKSLNYSMYFRSILIYKVLVFVRLCVQAIFYGELQILINLYHVVEGDERSKMTEREITLVFLGA